MSDWPALPLERWRATADTLHMWMQIVGKVRLARTPWLNHSWHATLYPTASGLTTSLVPHDSESFEIEFDFVQHPLHVRSTGGRHGYIPLEPQSVAVFHQRLMRLLDDLRLGVQIHMEPNEVAEPVRFDRDEIHRSYDADYAARFWQVLVEASRVFGLFRSRYLGKCSPVHFFWGAPDLAVTRFSGRTAPPHPGGVPHLPDRVVRDAYSHEVSSCGFWYGGGPVPHPVFYSYAYPEPDGYAEAGIRPAGASYNAALREFVLPYDAVREAHSPDDALLEFLQSTYEAAADLGRWDRPSLERGDQPSPHNAPKA